MRAATAVPDETYQAATSSGMPILVVDVSRSSQRLAGRLIEEATGRSVIYADDGNQALAFLEDRRTALVLTDLDMPGMDGSELVESIRSADPKVPIILMTASGSETAVMQALKAGAANYVPKKDLATDLVPTIRQLLAIVVGDRRKQRLLAHQTSRTRDFEIGNDTDLLDPLVDLVREDFEAISLGDENSAIRVAVAVQEALNNAVYHGNLECSSDLRQDDERLYYELADCRRRLEPYRSRRITVRSKVDRHEARVVIRDEGPGFDTACLDKPFDPEDLMKVGGRGMILIRTFLDEVTHNPSGNEITLVKRAHEPLAATAP